MLPTDRIEFVRVLNGMAAIKGKALTPEAIDLWWQSMQRWSIDDWKSAASHLLTSLEWMPTPYHFTQLRRAGELTAGEAWAKVLGGSPLTYGSREERAARAVGGQRHIRFADIEHALPHIERRFKDAYAELSDVDLTREALPHLIDDPFALPSNVRAKFQHVPMLEKMK
jgi:hypothetical protein